MKKLTLILIFAFLFTVVSPAAEWIAFSRDNEKSASAELAVSRSNEMVIDIEVPGVWLEDVEIDGETHKKIHLDNSSLTLQKGQPELRKVTGLLAVPFDGRVDIQVTDVQYEIIEDVNIVPSKGSLDRNVNPEEVPYEFGPVYDRDEWFPAIETIANVSEPFVMRDVSGVRYEVVPFQYNPAQESLKVITDITVAVSASGSRSSNPRVSAHVSSDFEGLYEDLFMNYTSPFADRRSDAEVPSMGKNLHIVTHSSLYDAVLPLAEWKTKTGYDVEIVTYEDVANDANSLKDYFQSEFDQGNLTFVTLVGDQDHIPLLRGTNEGAHSDQDYVRLTGDNFPDAFISRFSARNLEEANAMIQKTIRYEREPETGAEWYKSALAIASNEGSPADYEYARDLNIALSEYLDYNRFFEAFAPKSSGGGWTWKSIEPTFGEFAEGYDFPSYDDNAANKGVVSEALNTGVNIVNYIGHGSNTSWGTTGFNNSDVHNLDNGMMLPVIWSVACVNGNIQLDECYAEAWQRAGDEFGGGSLGMIAATTNMSWVPPLVWQKEINVEQMSQQGRRIGAVLNLYGMAKTVEEYGMANNEEGNRLIEQVIYFGEGSTPIRTEAPRAVEAEAVVVGNEIVVSVEGERASNLTVSAYDANLERNVTGVTQRDGYAKLPYHGQTHVTVYNEDIVPVVDLEIQK
ncbi:MAG: C25 family cysteine peptidase [Candidatus Muiribacteriota bacterium]